MTTNGPSWADTLGALLAGAGAPVSHALDALAVPAVAWQAAQAFGRQQQAERNGGQPPSFLQQLAGGAGTGTDPYLGIQPAVQGALPFVQALLNRGWEGATQQAQQIEAQQPETFPGQHFMQANVVPLALSGPAKLGGVRNLLAVSPASLVRDAAALAGPRGAQIGQALEGPLHAATMGAIGADLATSALNDQPDRGRNDALGVVAALLGTNARRLPGLAPAAQYLLSRSPKTRATMRGNEIVNAEQELRAALGDRYDDFMQQNSARLGALGGLPESAQAQALQEMVDEYAGRTGGMLPGTEGGTPPPTAPPPVPPAPPPAPTPAPRPGVRYPCRLQWCRRNQFRRHRLRRLVCQRQHRRRASCRSSIRT